MVIPFTTSNYARKILSLNSQHFDDLYNLRNVPDGDERFQWVYSCPPKEKDAFMDYIATIQDRKDRVKAFSMSTKLMALSRLVALCGPSIAKTRIVIP